MKIRTLITAVLFFVYCSKMDSQSSTLDAIFGKRYEHRIISQGDNRPDFDRRKDSIDLFLVSLHEKIDPVEFQKKAGWSDSLMRNRIDFLISKGWLSDNEKVLKPTVFIVSDKQGNELFKYGKPIANMIAQSIEKEIPNIREKLKTAGLKGKYDFDSLSFLILSNVLLDNWQIMQMEEDYLNSNRPERHGKNYYGGIMENTLYPRENFGIYGNQFGQVNDSTFLSIYGNNRNIANERLRNDKVYLDSVIVAAVKITPDVYSLFNEIAEEYKPKLIRILKDQDKYSHQVYEKTGYSDEIRFEEFFIWWYHFIYTDATNILARNGRLVIPEKGNFYYLQN